uniref:DUF4220 domain-containing protein n=1 Tax=Leersia perrieri TaxID=77586 RepID=A0A0D9WAP3_9ORYZ
MGFWVTTLIFLLAGVAASLFSLLCCNRGPSTNLMILVQCIVLMRVQWTELPELGKHGSPFTHMMFNWKLLCQFMIPFDLGYYSYGLLLDDVGNRLSCTAEATDQPYPKWGVSRVLKFEV